MPKRLKACAALGLLAAAFALFAASCGDDDPADGGTPTAEDSTPGAVASPTGDLLTPEDVLAKDPAVTRQAVVRWGFLFELSGPLVGSGFGIPTSDGVRLAVKEINEAGGFQVGDTIYTIELVERDTRSDVQQTIAAATELVRDEEVNVIFGPATVGEPQSTPITQGEQVLHFCPCQQRETTALSSKEKAQNESHWAFQTLLPFSILSKQGARNFLEDWPDFKKIAILCQNTQTGHDVCERTAEAYREVGLDVVFEEYFPPETTDYSPYLTRMRESDPDYLFNFHDPLAGAQIVRQALEQGVGRLHILTLPANVVEGLVGVPITTPLIIGAAPRNEIQPTSQEATDYFERYRAFTQESRGQDLPFAAFVSLLMYDYVYMLAGAMQQADTVEDTTAIADALETLRYNGVAEEEMRFNSRHLGVHGTDPCTFRAGQPLVCEHLPPPPEALEE